MRPMRRLPPVVFPVLCSLALAAAPHADQTFRSTVDAVRVDALVTRDGRPVPGLTTADFSSETTASCRTWPRSGSRTCRSR